MRVYVGLTRSELARARNAGALGPAPLPAYAVTPVLRESYASGDLEELEYAAMLAAAESCLPKLAAAPDEPARRFVAAAEVPDGDVTAVPGGAPAAVHVASGVAWRDVDAVHADDPEAAPAIEAAARAYAAAQAGDADAQFTVDEAEGWELMWFATQEVGELLE